MPGELQNSGTSARSATPGAPPRSAQAPVLSVVLPMYNEQEGMNRCLAAVREELDQLGKDYEIICVNDGSTDATGAQLDRAALADKNVRVVHLSRNFGKDAALTAGLESARGRAVVVMDADLQHPPDLLSTLVAAWEEGYEVVNGTKQTRGKERVLYRLFASVFNRLMGGAAGKSFSGASDYKLLDRDAVDALARLPEKTRFFRGLVHWVGFRTIDVPFDVGSRLAGTSKWPLHALIRYSLRNLLAFSALPLRLVASAGFGTLLFATALGAWTLFRKLRGDALTGFTTVILLQLIIGGLLLSGVGVIALYLSAIYDELKARPTYVVRRQSDKP
jgi:dolichol-phosphate mannosyltransferase